MKVACFVNPLVQARGPCFNFGWVETLANLLQSLRRDARCECMLIAGGWFKDWASQNQKGALLTGLRTVWIDELALYRRLRALGELPTALDQTAYQADDAEHPALRIVAEAMARDANGFEPDIIIGFAGQANYLAECGHRRCGCTSSGDTSGGTPTRSAYISTISARTQDRRS